MCERRAVLTKPLTQFTLLVHMHVLFKKLLMEKNMVSDVRVFGLLAAGAWHVWEAGH